MRRILFCLIVLTGCLVCYAQQAAYSKLKCELASEKPSVLPENKARIDHNGDTIACVIVRSNLGDLSFVGNIFESPEKSENIVGYSYLVNLINGSKDLTIRSKNFHEGHVVFPKPVKSGELWYVDVEGLEAPEVNVAEIDNSDNTLKVRIETEPFVDLYVDEELVATNKVVDKSQFPYIYTLDLEEGKHYITSKYGDEEYPVKLNLKKDWQDVDSRMGGEVIAKNAGGFAIIPVDGPEGHQIYGSGKNTYQYDGLLGSYRMIGHPSAIRSTEVVRDFKVGQRSKTVFRLDEMVTYAFIMWHGSNLQPFGFTVGGCKNFGWTFSFNADAKSKIDTPYGETEFYGTDSSGKTTEKIKSTAWTITTGPMIRLWHKWYMKIEGGMVRYLQTSEPHMLTADFEYKTGLAVDAEFFWRIKALMIGAGYQKQFVKSAYNPSIANQVSFSLGIAF